MSTRLLAIERGRLKPRIDELTKGMPSADEKLAELIRSRAVSFQKTKADTTAGKAVFNDASFSRDVSPPTLLSLLSPLNSTTRS